MTVVLRVLLAVMGLSGILVCAAFLTDPEKVALALGLTGEGTLGVGTLRGDMSAFFGLGGACLLLAARRQRRELLLVPLALFGLALLGRSITLLTHGYAAEVVQPMAIEASSILLILLGRWALPPKAVTG